MNLTGIENYNLREVYFKKSRKTFSTGLNYLIKVSEEYRQIKIKSGELKEVQFTIGKDSECCPTKLIRQLNNNEDGLLFIEKIIVNIKRSDFDKKDIILSKFIELECYLKEELIIS